MGPDRHTHTLYLPTAEFGNKKSARGRPVAKPGSFVIVVAGRSNSDPR